MSACLPRHPFSPRAGTPGQRDWKRPDSGCREGPFRGAPSAPSTSSCPAALPQGIPQHHRQAGSAIIRVQHRAWRIRQLRAAREARLRGIAGWLCWQRYPPQFGGGASSTALMGIAAVRIRPTADRWCRARPVTRRRPAAPLRCACDCSASREAQRVICIAHLAQDRDRNFIRKIVYNGDVHVTIIVAATLGLIVFHNNLRHKSHTAWFCSGIPDPKA